MADTNAFRKRLLHLDESILQDHGVLPEEGGLSKATDTFTKRRGQKRTPGSRGGKQGGGGRNITERGDGGRASGEYSGTIDGGESDDDGGDWNEIPFSWVVRGRQERHLFDQQVPSVSYREVSVFLVVSLATRQITLAFVLSLLGGSCIGH